MQDLQNITSQYNYLKGKKQGLVEQRDANVKSIADLEKDNHAIKLAHGILRDIANQAQQEFKNEVDGLVTLAVRSVFDENFRFDLQISTQSGRLQCTPVVWENIDGHETEFIPKDEMGGSIIDPISFALRIVLHKFDQNPTRSTFWLDEPMKNVGHGELLERAGNMINELSNELGIQLIIITHEPELIEVADRAWRITRVKGISNVVMIKGGANREVTKKRKIIK